MGHVGECRVYTKVVADFLHPGHIRFFKAARELGTHLTVCVVPDARVSDNKAITPVFTTDERVEMVAACRWVDHVITDGPKVVSLDFMTKHQFRIYAFGANDASELAAKLADCPELPVEMRAVIPRTPGISSTLIRQRLQQHNH
jgi:cytidyltransferase-like protein